MNVRFLIILIGVSRIAHGAPPEAPVNQDIQAAQGAPAPLVSLVFGNESKTFETVFTLVQVDQYFGNKNAGAYYPEFIPVKGKLTRDTFAFDPGALTQGPNVYPFMFSYQGDLYYLVFVTSKILTEKTEYPFFASIIKLVDIDQKSNSAEIQTIANLYFNPNDTLAVLLGADKLEFYNVTQKTKAGFLEQKAPAPAPVRPQSVPVQLVPKTVPKPVVAQKKKVLLQPNRRPVAAKPLNPKRSAPVLRPKTTPRPARAV